MSRRPFESTDDLKDQIEELKKKLAEKEGKLTAADATVTDLKKRLSDAATADSASAKQLAEKDTKLKAVEKDNAELQRQLETAKKLLEEFKELKAKNTDLTTRLDEASKKLAAAEEAAAKKAETAVKAAKVTGGTTAMSLGFLNGKEQNAVIEQVDIARAAAKAITGLTETAAERSEMLSRLLG